jgi:hypothetical protein
MKQIIILLFLLGATISCAKENTVTLKNITGTWHYDLLLNGTPMGDVKISSILKDNTYINIIDMTMEGNGVTNIVTEKVVETKDFTPIMTESISITRHENMENIIRTRATFKGSTVTLTRNKKTTRLTLKKPFRLNGNYLHMALLKKGLKKGTVISTYIYDPTLEPGETVPVTLTVVGKEKILIRGKKIELYHLRQRIEKLKSIDIYIDSQGIIWLESINMLNNNLVLIKRD